MKKGNNVLKTIIIRPNRTLLIVSMAFAWISSKLFFVYLQPQRFFFRLEPRCGPMTGASAAEMAPMQSSISPAMSESDLPQPLVVRTPSVSLKWPSDGVSKVSPNRQVLVNNGYGGASGHVFVCRSVLITATTIRVMKLW